MTDEWTQYTNDIDSHANEYARLFQMRQHFERKREKSRRKRRIISTVIVSASWIVVGAAIGYAVVEYAGWWR